MYLSSEEKAVVENIAVALDLPSIHDNIELGRKLSGMVRYVKTSSALIDASNRGMGLAQILHEFSKDGRRNIFGDLKFHDTPRTVYNSSREICSAPGLDIFTVHIEGGEAMCKEAIRAAEDVGAASKIRGQGILKYEERAKVIGITVLTSLDDADLRRQGFSMGYNDLVKLRTELAREWGLDGVTCPASMAGVLEKEFGADFMYVLTGMTWKGVKGAEQKYPYSPEEGINSCQNPIMVAGSVITQSKDPVNTLHEIIAAAVKAKSNPS